MSIATQGPADSLGAPAASPAPRGSTPMRRAAGDGLQRHVSIPALRYTRDARRLCRVVQV
eukprot:scaffold87818_cov36-Tisochrysis_lutea.AAC.3